MAKLVSLETVDAFEPEIVEAMSTMLDDICSALDMPPTATGARAVIARRVIEMVRRGERDPARIRAFVLADLDRTPDQGERVGADPRRDRIGPPDAGPQPA